jgi:hypothetical protein
MIVYYTVNDPVFSEFTPIEISDEDIECWGLSSAAEMCAANYQMNSNWGGESQNDFYLWQGDPETEPKLLGKFVVVIDFEPIFTAYEE